jgi:transposase
VSIKAGANVKDGAGREQAGGSHDGGDRAAIIYTLIETAKMNGIEPESYLRAVITRIADHPMKQIDELLPWKIAA